MKNMDNVKKYREDKQLSVEELEQLTEKIFFAKFNRDRARRWEEQLATKHGVAKGNSPEAKSIPLTKRRPWLFLAASFLVLALATTFVLTQNNTTSSSELAATYIEQDFFNNQSTTKGEEDVQQLSLDAANAYNNKDFATAISLYTQLDQNIVEHSFFLGVSYLYNNAYPKAVSTLEHTQQIDTEKMYSQETQWFLALAYIQNKQLDKAKQLLQNIRVEDWNYSKAQDLLNTL